MIRKEIEKFFFKTYNLKKKKLEGYQIGLKWSRNMAICVR